jgi:hypothetical protein
MNLFEYIIINEFIKVANDNEKLKQNIKKLKKNFDNQEKLILQEFTNEKTKIYNLFKDYKISSYFFQIYHYGGIKSDSGNNDFVNEKSYFHNIKTILFKKVGIKNVKETFLNQKEPFLYENEDYDEEIMNFLNNLNNDLIEDEKEEIKYNKLIILLLKYMENKKYLEKSTNVLINFMRYNFKLYDLKQKKEVDKDYNELSEIFSLFQIGLSLLRDLICLYGLDETKIENFYKIDFIEIFNFQISKKKEQKNIKKSSNFKNLEEVLE